MKWLRSNNNTKLHSKSLQTSTTLSKPQTRKGSKEKAKTRNASLQLIHKLISQDLTGEWGSLRDAQPPPSGTLTKINAFKCSPSRLTMIAANILRAFHAMPTILGVDYKNLRSNANDSSRTTSHLIIFRRT